MEIKKENRGKFTASAKKAGYSVQGYTNHILNNKENYSTTQIKRANFAKNIGGARIKKASGGIVYGSEITSKNVNGKEVDTAGNIIGSVGSGAASGAAIGSVIPGIGTAIGAIVGGIGGAISGIFSDRKKRKQMASAKEAERQQIISAMYDRNENDEYNLMQTSNTQFSDNIYMKCGGRIKRASGGLIPNSSNSQVAYGATHEQFNNNTGTTGIPIGNYEVEGGGDVNGVLKPGEVIIDDAIGANVFSDTLKYNNSKSTYADLAKKLTDKKGNLEKVSLHINNVINESLDEVSKNKYNKLKRGTSIRNTEKLVTAMNINDGKISEIDNTINKLYNHQEITATMKGLRNDSTIARYGGRYKKDLGGSMTLFNLAGNLFNNISTRSAINFEENLPVPQQNRINTPVYNYNYNINSQLQEIDSQVNATKKYITSNSNNPQVARAAIGQLTANAARSKNAIYSEQNKVQDEMYNRNINARYQNELTTNQIDYQNTINKYNKSVDINSKRNAANQQLLQSFANAGQDYINWQTQLYGMDMQALTNASDSITNEMNDVFNKRFGLNLNSLLPNNKKRGKRINRRNKNIGNFDIDSNIYNSYNTLT